MSTNNNASQTLFRFVSLRNPQLTETKRRNLGFIHRPSGAKGIFDDAVSSRSDRTLKLQALSSKIIDFTPSAIKTEKELETGVFATLLVIGRKISKKETLSKWDWEYTKEYYSSLIDSNKELTLDAMKIFDNLWNNLIYQIVSQKDFYVKEAISHILKAIHIGFAQNMDINEDVLKANGDKKPLDNALNGKIVMPKYLFLEEDNLSTGNNVALKSEASANVSLAPKDLERLNSVAKNDLIVTESLLRKEKLEKLNSELQKLQKSYHKSSEKAYQTEYEKYKDSYRKELEEYEKISEQIDILLEQKASEEELQRLYNHLKELNLPRFVFSYKNEITLSDLQEKLSPESLDLFIELCSAQDINEKFRLEIQTNAKRQVISDTELRIGDQYLQIDESFDTYNEVISHVQNNIAETMQTALDKATFEQTQYANIGGALIPIVNARSITHLAYNLQAVWSRSIFIPNNGFINFSFEVQDNSWSVANAKILLESNTGVHQETISNISVLNNMISFPAIMVNKFASISKIRIDIYFNNGSEAYLELLKIPNNQLLTGILTLKERTENPIKDSEETYKRKNFGIKRLGVADFLKVVQSVHAYVPGEVSNIENVMASELRHKSSVARDYSEITDTTSKSQETEKISDTSKTSRTDMQTEVAKEVEKQQAITAHTRATYGGYGMSFEIGAEYANNTAQHDSTRQAVMKSQEITERAMERVLTKISEERVQKIIKEYTETNVHEFDNRGKALTTNEPPQHITGVYRWIDKKMKNQIYNYGKRNMFEFMVPEPARLHRLSLAVSKGQVLTAPIDPRKADRPYNMPDPKSATKALLQYWAQIYGVKLTDLPKEDAEIYQEIKGRPNSTGSFGAVGTPINITPNYAAKTMKLGFYMNRNSSWHNSNFYCSNGRGGDRDLSFGGKINQGTVMETGLNIEGAFNFLYRGRNIEDVTLNVTLYCKLSDTFMQTWQQENFNLIITAYEEAYKKFQEEQARLDAEQKEKEAAAKEKTGTFYRYMEHDVLKHNCIAYLLQDYLSVLGQVMTNGAEKDTVMENYQVYLGEDLDKYTALAKFMEQAFEWEIMDYTFYPYYWANRKLWQEMYVSESTDPLFRSFLQAGMARVIVTVKPGFEDAVNFFLTTGKIWNGGEVPVIGDPMYMSIVDEMRQPTGKPQGKYWITRVPTTLTIIQDKSTGLPVDQPLPIFPELDSANCENPLELETKTSFEPRDVQLSHGTVDNSTLD
ncbi:hypothetical protein NZ698_07650 [Chryseobacterium sp. PBS4-4]|uniref:Uncharacterized protein n=1 Tax=Chryseobacterium edaphi TaxID=2976532 RepID=A0ABT2W4C0_9FLAO|nr:hypothetical protein [Chryseobacterium edaphi]MCU7617067.1 hypothetical protein [Chryseobacterium edaphi]